MSQKKNNKPAWKDSLDELEHVPGIEMPDIDLGWEKLNKRLRSPMARVEKILAVVGLLGTIIMSPDPGEEDEGDENW